MSIYVGGEKAKFYKGDYGPAQFYKGDVKIVGYTDGEKVGAQISGGDTYNDALLPTIEGKSAQTVTVHGKNLLNCARRTDRPDTPSTWNPDTGTLLVNGKWFTAVLITLDPDADYYFSAIREGATAAGGGAVSIFVATGAASGDQVAAIAGGKGTFHTRPAVTEYQILLYSAYGTQGECTFRNLSVSKGTQPIPYEPFVPNSPSPDYPSPIRSSESFDVVSCGRNLIGLQPQATQTQYGVAYRVENQKLLLNGFSTGNFAITFEVKCALKSGTYILSTRKYTDIAVGDFFINDLDNTPIFRTASLSPRSSSVSTSISSVKASFWCNAGVEFRDVALPLQLEEGTIATPYQPYHATTAHITDPLRSVGGVADSIEVSEGKVEVVRRVAIRELTGGATERWSQYGASIGKKYACMYGQLLIGKQLGQILFTHDTQADSVVISGNALGVWPNTSTMWPEHVYWGIEYSLIGTSPTSTVEENVTALRAYLSHQSTAGTPVTAQYKLATPTRTDITATPLGQALLALRTQPHYTQVYTNATLPPTIRARIKEMEM